MNICFNHILLICPSNLKNVAGKMLYLWFYVVIWIFQISRTLWYIKASLTAPLSTITWIMSRYLDIILLFVLNLFVQSSYLFTEIDYLPGYVATKTWWLGCPSTEILINHVKLWHDLFWMNYYCIASWHLKSPAARLFLQEFVQRNINSIKGLQYPFENF